MPSMRCPKTGKYVSEMECMYCNDTPEGWTEDAYQKCREFNEPKEAPENV